MINVILFCRPKSYKTMSMDVYAKNLFEGMRSVSGLSVRSFRPKEFHIPLGGRYFTLWLYYPYIAKKQKADINHILDHSIAHLINGLNPKKTIITCHDLIGLEVSGSTSFWKRKIFWKEVISNMIKAAKIITDSQSTKNDILKHSSYRADDIIVIHLGVSTKFKKIEKEKIEERFRFTKPAILHVGHSNFYKNVEGLIKAVALLGRDIKLVKVGPISRRQLGLLKKFKLDFTQFIDLSEDELAQLYNSVELLAYPSWYEGFGLPVLEAMACGCPVVCSNVSSLPEIAAEASIMIRPDDISSITKAIEKVLISQALRQELSEKGIIQARKFSWEKTAQETVGVYKRLYS